MTKKPIAGVAPEVVAIGAVHDAIKGLEPEAQGRAPLRHPRKRNPRKLQSARQRKRPQGGRSKRTTNSKVLVQQAGNGWLEMGCRPNNSGSSSVWEVMRSS
jgi:hypothetical protein